MIADWDEPVTVFEPIKRKFKPGDADGRFSCNGKKAFSSRSSAKNAARLVAERVGGGMHAYDCHRCGCFHIANTQRLG